MPCLSQSGLFTCCRLARRLSSFGLTRCIMGFEVHTYFFFFHHAQIEFQDVDLLFF